MSKAWSSSTLERGMALVRQASNSLLEDADSEAMQQELAKLQDWVGVNIRPGW